MSEVESFHVETPYLDKEEDERRQLIKKRKSELQLKERRDARDYMVKAEAKAKERYLAKMKAAADAE